MAVQHRKIETGIERFCNLPVIRIKAGSIAELNCREAAYLNHPIHRMQKAVAFSTDSDFPPSEVFS
jgi:hypothetical protein